MPEGASSIGFGALASQWTWTWNDKRFAIAVETLGDGPPMLLLPAFSTVSSIAEMGGLAQLLAADFRVHMVDWPGFGQSPRPRILYRPELYHAFLRDFVAVAFDRPVAVVAAGHGAGFVMRLHRTDPSPWSGVVLVAPTWRGPFPTAFGGKRGALRVLERIVRLPGVGHVLYRMNASRFMIRAMYRQHVYGNPDAVTPELVEQRWRVARHPGARYAAAAFVTGALDTASSREEFLEWFGDLDGPILVVIGEQTPPRSRAEMNALADLKGIEAKVLPGSLALHDENPVEVSNAILEFLRDEGETEGSSVRVGTG